MVVAVIPEAEVAVAVFGVIVLEPDWNPLVLLRPH